MSFILISLFNTRFHSHLVSFHFFIFKNKKNKILCNFTCDLLFCLRISDLKCGQAKISQANGSLRGKMFPFFWSHLLAIISRNVGMKGHLRKEIVLLKYQVFRFGTKSGGQFELLNWLEKSTRLLMLEDYDIVHFTIHNNKKIRTGTSASTSSIFTHTHIPLFDLYTTANDKSWCEVRNALKAV